MFKHLFFLFIAFRCVSMGSGQNVSVRFDVSSLSTEIDQCRTVKLVLSKVLSQAAKVDFLYQADNGSLVNSTNVIVPIPSLLIPTNISSILVNVTGKNAGSVVVVLNSSDEAFARLNETYTRVTVVHSLPLNIVIAVIGWIYFVAWSVSFYPQVFENWRRKSVVGLNFDFLAYNLTGFLAYSAFNVGLFWIAEIKKEYQAAHPRGVNPVLANDVFFSLHALFITIVTISQCFFFERGGQKVSKVCMILVAGSWIFVFVSLFIAIAKVISWLTYLYFFSYVKLGVTLIKYVPQAYMNFQRKSTEGWSIGNVLLDFTGGSFSLLQMFLLSYNNDDWSSIFGDPTKFGLGFFSVLFDIVFIVQHYVLYRHSVPYTLVNNEEPDQEQDLQAEKID